ncbi:hypothetical protein ACHAXT_001908 [Thalassiosira profunda]
MGLKFLRRKKDRAVPLLDDGSDHGMKSDEGDASMAKLAALQPAGSDPIDNEGAPIQTATSGDFSAPSVRTETPARADAGKHDVVGRGESEVTPATAVETPSPKAALVGQLMEAAVTPSPAQQASVPNTLEDTPLQSNKMEGLGENTAAFDNDDDDGDSVDTGSRLELMEPPEKSPKLKKKKKKGILKFLKPSKKDTAHIVSPDKGADTAAKKDAAEEEAEEKSHVLVLRPQGEEEAFEMELSVAGAAGYAVDGVGVPQHDDSRGLVPVDEGDEDAVQNLSTQFDDAAGDGGIFDAPAVPTAVGGKKNELGLGYLSKNDKTFLSRLRKSPSKKDKAEKGRAPTPVSASGKLPRSPGNKGAAKVPEFIAGGSDDRSMPSMLTEPEMRRLRSANGKGGRTGTPSPLETPGLESKESGSVPRSSPTFGQAAAPSPLAEAIQAKGEEKTDLASYLGTATGFTATVASTAVSVAQQAGGIEKLLGAFNCGEDTTLGGVVKSVLQCEPMCGTETAGKDIVDLAVEEEEKQVLKFQSKMIKNGVKLIYHESPSRASPSSDWIQSTVKLFLRPGNCHGTTLQQPTLAWAVLPVVSRTKGIGSIGSFDSADGKMWATLGLLDVHSILVDEGDGSTTAAESKVDDGATAAKSTGFFSITATNGAVYVFEAPTPKDRDYVVNGLRGCIARLAYHMIAGDANVIGELYSEDAGALTGELPSLVSPWKAVGRVTHDFMDRQ